MKKAKSNHAHGKIRQSQLITTFGPGSMVDLPNHSVLIGGLDDWIHTGFEISEPRLIEKLCKVLDIPQLKLFTPPPADEDPAAPPNGITAWQFPEWFIVQHIQSDHSHGRARRLVHRNSLTHGKFLDEDKKKYPVVPVRFVQACRRGHISDIDWYDFVHKGNKPCRRPLWMDERGTSGDLSEVYIRCECGDERSIGTCQ